MATTNPSRDGRSVEERVDESFPAPEFREYQREVIVKSVRALEEEGKDVLVLDAPTGFGKSIVLYTILDVLDGASYYGTPLKILQEQLVNDDFVGDDVVQIQGRSNYKCVLPGADPGTTVDVGKCQRDTAFECDHKGECPYYVQKDKALGHDKTVMNLAYMMAESFVPDGAEGKFGPRQTLVIDECQSLEDWAMNFVSTTVSSRQVPDLVWQQISIPDADDMGDIDEAVEWLREEVLPAVQVVREHFDTKALLSEDDTKEKDRLQQFEQKLERFLDDYEDHHWVYQVERVVRKNSKNERKVVFKPVYVGRFLDDLVWSRADQIILSSATVPKGNWLEEIGLADRKILRLPVPAIFPEENRPIVTGHTVGKMTQDQRDENAWPMAQKIREIAEHHEGEKGMVHCRGYNIAKLLKRAFTNHQEGRWFRDNVFMQDRSDREGSLEEWLASDKQVFFSVNMAEGVDLEGEKCRWQVLAKTLYPFMGDDRVRYRINELDDWTWYNMKAVTQIEQAYGRAVRSETDEAVFYILDSSAVGLLQREAELFHDWFKNAIIDMELR